MAKRESAYSQILKEKQDAATGAKPEQETEIQQSSKAVKKEDGKTVTNRKTVKNGITAKITIYPTQEQLEKLYDLMEAYRQKTGFKINQQDMIRRLIDLANIETVLP